NLNQDKATKPQTVQIVRQGEATPYWFKVNPLYSAYSQPTYIDTADSRYRIGNQAGHLDYTLPNTFSKCAR
ncbi:MAG: hypothetical protein E6899_12020, partial [Neisseria sp.]|nr:hypothetical protein [Neisseria sp.]